MVPPDALPAPLLRGLVPIADRGALERLGAALADIGVAMPSLARVHLDAAGYSPEIAAALGDPAYLGHTALDAHSVWLLPEQAAAPWIHPGIGFARAGLEALRGQFGPALRGLSERDALIVHARAIGPRPASAREAADLERLELRLRTPSGLLRTLRESERRQAAFLASDRLWLDDVWIDELRVLSRAVRDLPPIPDALQHAELPLGSFFSPEFGGTYVLQAPDRRGRAATHVLSGVAGVPADGVPLSRTRHVLHRGRPGAKPVKRFRMHRSPRGRTVIEQPLEARAAVDLLLGAELATFDERALRRNPAQLAERQQWLVLDHLRARTGDEGGDAAREYLELEDALRRIKAGRPIAFADLAPISKLRLLTPAPGAQERLVRHLLAFLDPLDVGRAWSDARDLFFRRLARLDPDQRAWFARWVDDAGSRLPA